MMKILITGGKGYLGSAIAKNLQEGHRERTIIIGSHSSKEALFENPKNFTYRQFSFSNQESLLTLCEKVDVILHLAALDETQTELNPENALHVNSLGTFNLLEAAKLKGVKKFFYFSTAHVYGSPLEGYLTEEAIPRPVSHYALTHKFAEDYVLSNNYKTLNPKVTVFRLSNGIGAPGNLNNERWTLVVNDLCNQAITKKEMLLKSSGKQYRDFVTLADINKVIAYFIEAEPSSKITGLFNVGSGVSMQICEIAALIQERCKDNFNFTPELIIPKTQSAEDFKPLNYSIQKLINLGIKPENNFKKAIDETLFFCNKVVKKEYAY